MKKQANQPSENEQDIGCSNPRRDFFKGLALAAVAGSVASIGSASAATETVTKSEQTGYHETDHIRAYYATL